MSLTRRKFLLNLLLTTGAFSAARLLAAGWREDTSLPALDGFGLEGQVPAIAGKAIYLDFWASWCGPCKASFPVLDKWQRQLSAKGFSVVGVSVDEKATEMQDFLKRLPVSFPIVRDASHKLVAAADVSTMPTSFLIDRKGKVRHVHNGFRLSDEALLHTKISALIAEG